jgi:hypothetical protein
MLFTRFWTLILVLGAVAGLSTAMIATNIIDERADDQAREALIRDRFELEAILKLDARSRIDAIAPLAAQGDIRTALREASGRSAGAAIDEAVSTRLRTRLGELNVQLAEMAGDLVFAVDRDGTIVAQVGGVAPPPGAGLGAFPLVRRALDGFVRDDVWVYNGEVFRMAARPVVEGGQYVGAIIHGKRFDDAFAGRLVTRLSGASLGFFLRDQIVAAAMPDGVPGSPRRDDLAAPLAAAIAAPTFAAGEISDAAELATGGIAVYAPVVGSAAHAQVGYTLGRPRAVLGSPMAILNLASGEDWASLPWPMLAGAALVLLLITMLSIWLERDRPLSRFRATAERLGKRDIDRFVPPEFGGALRSAAASINEALDKVQDSASAGAVRRKAADLDSILGKAPESASTPFFGFAGDKSSPSKDFELPAVPPAPSSPGMAPPAMASPAKAMAPPPVQQTAVPLPPAKPAAPGAFGGPAAPPPPARPAPGGPPPAAARPAPAKPAAEAALSSTLIGVGSGATEGAGMVQAQAASRISLGPPLNDDDDDGATMVARVPEELLKKAGSGEEAEQEAHYREVFEQFLATKKQCNEPVAGLTFDKFVVTLRKNREQIVLKHGAAKVRFTVYVKDGKAALKATPIKE